MERTKTLESQFDDTFGYLIEKIDDQSTKKEAYETALGVFMSIEEDVDSPERQLAKKKYERCAMDLMLERIIKIHQYHTNQLTDFGKKPLKEDLVECLMGFKQDVIDNIKKLDDEILALATAKPETDTADDKPLKLDFTFDLPIQNQSYSSLPTPLQLLHMLPKSYKEEVKDLPDTDEYFRDTLLDFQNQAREKHGEIKFFLGGATIRKQAEVGAALEKKEAATEKYNKIFDEIKDDETKILIHNLDQFLERHYHIARESFKEADKADKEIELQGSRECIQKIITENRDNEAVAALINKHMATKIYDQQKLILKLMTIRDTRQTIYSIEGFPTRPQTQQDDFLSVIDQKLLFESTVFMKQIDELRTFLPTPRTAVNPAGGPSTLAPMMQNCHLQ